MMRYRVTIELEDLAREKYSTWIELYQQILHDLNIEAVVTGLNSPEALAPTPKASKEEK